MHKIAMELYYFIFSWRMFNAARYTDLGNAIDFATS